MHLLNSLPQLCSIHDNCHYQECDFSAITSGSVDRVAGTPLKTGRCSTFIGDAARVPCPGLRCVRDGMLRLPGAKFD
jgi:hypothetical protein